MKTPLSNLPSQNAIKLLLIKAWEKNDVEECREIVIVEWDINLRLKGLRYTIV